MNLTYETGEPHSVGENQEVYQAEILDISKTLTGKYKIKYTTGHNHKKGVKKLSKSAIDSLLQEHNLNNPQELKGETILASKTETWSSDGVGGSTHSMKVTPLIPYNATYIKNFRLRDTSILTLILIPLDIILLSLLITPTKLETKLLQIIFIIAPILLVQYYIFKTQRTHKILFGKIKHTLQSLP